MLLNSETLEEEWNIFNVMKLIKETNFYFFYIWLHKYPAALIFII